MAEEIEYTHEFLAEKLERLEAMGLARDEKMEVIAGKLDSMAELLETIAAFRTGGRFIVQVSKVILAIGVVVALFKSGLTAFIDFKP